MPYTLTDARKALVVPPGTENNNAVQDGQWRLRAALDLAAPYYTDADPAPDYVLRAVNGLESWVRHAERQGG